MLKFIVDNRESIKNEFTEMENIEISNLSIGDYQILLDNKLFIIIERKTITDYASSIKDGRLREQKKRLLANSENAFILYLVEGDLTINNSSFQFNKVDKHTIISSIMNTMMRDNINVFHTKNQEETIFFLKSIYLKMNNQGNTFLNNKTNYRQDLVNNLDCSKNKSGNINPQLCFQMMLNCIPKVSNKTSERLSNKFETLYNFIEFIEKVPKENKLESIINIRMNDEDKARKISKIAANNILEYLGIYN